MLYTTVCKYRVNIQFSNNSPRQHTYFSTLLDKLITDCCSLRPTVLDSYKHKTIHC